MSGASTPSIELRLGGSATAAGGVLRFVRAKPLGAVGGVLVVLVLFLAIFGAALTQDPTQISAETQQAPSVHHLFGTDTLGRDYFARIVAGARTSMVLSLVAMALGSMIALAVGIISAYAGGAFDLLSQRLVDVMLAFPGLILLLFFAAIFGPTQWAVAAALGLLFAPGLSRLVRATTLSTVSDSYVEAARVIGAPSHRIVWRHVFPNIAPPLLIFVTAGLGGVILAEGALSFLGLGVAPPTPSWGRELSAARAVWRLPWLSIFPGLAITLTVLGFNLLGDALRDVWDPRLRGAR
jgi:peptide/nickel transport system permease protein